MTPWIDRWWFGPAVCAGALLGGPIVAFGGVWWIGQVACWWFPWIAECAK